MMLPFRIDVYEKTIAHNDSGQPVNDWELRETISCDFMPARAEERLVGRVQNPVSYLIFIDGHTDVTVRNQLRNLRDKDGDKIEEGSFNVIGVRKYHGWAKVDHQTLNIQKILD